MNVPITIKSTTGGDNLAVDETTPLQIIDPDLPVLLVVNVPTGNTGSIEIWADSNRLFFSNPVGPQVLVLLFIPREGPIFLSNIQPDTLPTFQLPGVLLGPPNQIRINAAIPGAAGRRWRYAIYGERR